MIPRAFITEWRVRAPWVHDAQVEQDLIISRALVAIFSHPLLHEALVFRGGTALYKLHLPALRYSEDIDLVQTKAEPAGPMRSTMCSMPGSDNRGPSRTKGASPSCTAFGRKTLRRCRCA